MSHFCQTTDKTALLVLQGGLVCTAFRLPEDKKIVYYPVKNIYTS